MRLTNLALLSTGLLFALFACRGGGDSGDDAPMPDAPPSGPVTIMQIQNEAMPVGTAVEVRGVVVTAIDTYGERTGDFFVQDPAGGAFSGIKVFAAPVDQVAALAVGDVVDITNAEKDEFALTSDTSNPPRKVTELKGAAGGMMTVTKKGAGTVPAPAAVDAKAIAAMTKAEREAEWEKWEGVLIKVTNARQHAAKRAFDNTAPGDDAYEFRITGVARVQSGLAALNDDSAFGVCYESITGIGDYFFNDLVLPRAPADIVSGGSGCNPMTTSIVMTQTGTNTEVADLTNVVVTAVDLLGDKTKGYWVADNAQGALNNGVYVFTGETIPTGIAVGATINLQSAVDEFDRGSNGGPPMGDTITQLVSATHTAVSTGAAVLPLTATAAQVSDIGATGEAYEGVYVQLLNVKVTNANAGAGKVELTDNAGGKVIMDNDIFEWTAPLVNKCYSSLSGIMNVQIFDNIRTLNPRNTLDFVDGAACN